VGYRPDAHATAMVGAPPSGALPRAWRRACSVRFPEKIIPAVRHRLSWGRGSNLNVSLSSAPTIGWIRPYKIVCDLPASRRRLASRGLGGNLPMNWVADIRGICTQAAAARGAGGHVGVLGAASDSIAMGVRNVRFFPVFPRARGHPLSPSRWSLRRHHEGYRSLHESPRQAFGFLL